MPPGWAWAGTGGGTPSTWENMAANALRFLRSYNHALVEATGAPRGPPSPGILLPRLALHDRWLGATLSGSRAAASGDG